MIINIQAQYKLKNNIVRANSAYLAPQGNNLWCRIVHYDPLNAKQSFKKWTCLGYVKMQTMGTHNVIKEWRCAYKITHISAATSPRLLNMVSD